MENLTVNDSLLIQNDIATRNYQNYSPTTSCSLSACSLSSSPNSVSPNYSRELSETDSVENVSRRSSEPSIEFRHYQNSSDNYLNSSISDDHNISNGNLEMNCARPVNRFFPDGVVDILNKWFYENQNYPYPDENMTNVLAKDANISAKQVRKWFANKRVRSNKCYKQTFRIRKDIGPAKSHLNRRQTKSVSDGESLHLNNQALYYENEFEEDQSRVENEVMNSRKSWYDQQLSHMSSSSSSSSSGSSTSSSPSQTSTYSTSPINNNRHYYNEIPLEQFHNTNNHGIAHSHSMNSIDYFQSVPQIQQVATNLNQNSNALAAIYNPYFLMNLLQNPSMALQTVLANRLMNSTEIKSENSYELTNPNLQSTPNVPTNKRKTHLSNRFLNDNLHLIQEVSGDQQHSVKSEETYDAPNLRGLLIPKNYNDNNSTCSNDILNTNNNFNINFNNSNRSSMHSSFSLDELSMSINSTSANTSFHKETTKKSTKKINFGDISSLI